MLGKVQHRSRHQTVIACHQYRDAVAARQTTTKAGTAVVCDHRGSVRHARVDVAPCKHTSRQAATRAQTIHAQLATIWTRTTAA